MKRYFLALVLLLAFVLRVSWLSSFPSGFTPDEASFGYDAYSLLKTGADQWGHSLPLILESFGDNKAPLYAYLSTPFVAIFGLSKFAIRLPNALLGTAAVYITYLLTLEFLKKSKLNIASDKFELVVGVSALLLAISPWHIMMSRGAFEANLTTFFLPLAVYLFLKGLDNSKYLIYSALIFGLNMFSYHAARFVSPLIGLFLIISYRDILFRKIGNYHKLAAIVVAIFFIATAYTVKNGALSRAGDVSIFKLSLMEASTDRIKAINAGMNPTLARLIHNKYQAGVRHFISSYLLYFSPQFYFINGAGEATYGMIPGRGVLYWFELPLLILFIAYALKNIKSRFVQFLIFWIIVAPIPAALSIGPGYAANRAEITLPALTIALSLGGYMLVVIAEKITPQLKRYLSIFSLFAIVVFVAYFIEDYFVLSPMKTAKDMLYGNLEAAYWLADYAKGRSVIVSRSLSEPHIYIAFAEKTEPTYYQKAVINWDFKKIGLSWVDQMPEYSLGSYIFTSIDYLKYRSFENTLLVGKPDEFPKDVVPDKIIYYPNGDPAIYILSTSKQIYASL